MGTVIVQLVEVYWTKISRPAPASAVRNALPRALHLPLFEECTYAFHHVRFEEERDFAEQTIAFDHGPAVPRSEHEILLRINEAGELVVGFSPTSVTGQPSRPLATSAVRARIGAYARIVSNGRHNTSITGFGAPWYRQATYNVGLAERPDIGSIFISREPQMEKSFEADLF
jgi:hypothetical protein